MHTLGSVEGFCLQDGGDEIVQWGESLFGRSLTNVLETLQEFVMDSIALQDVLVSRRNLMSIAGCAKQFEGYRSGFFVLPFIRSCDVGRELITDVRVDVYSCTGTGSFRNGCTAMYINAVF